MPATSSTCPTCSFSVHPTALSPHQSSSRLIKHWASIHPTLLTWVQARLTELGKGMETESDDGDDIVINEITQTSDSPERE